MTEVFEQFQVGNRVLKICYDPYPENPRDWDNLGTMVCWHRRYLLGDEHNFESPEKFFREVNHKNAIILPLYLYDHSGITMNTTGFHCPWDSGLVGFIYVKKEKIREEFGVKRVTKKIRKIVEECLVNEVKIYDFYLRGEVFGYVIEENGEVIDSCWGFYGLDFKENGILDYLPKEFRQMVA
mgnify:CR=1 FL=1